MVENHTHTHTLTNRKEENRIPERPTKEEKGGKKMEGKGKKE